MLVAAPVLLTLQGLPAAAANSRPNIVFILADDLGWTDLGCQGSKYYESPNIDKLAKAGMRFTNGYTCGPNCQPTRAALMSGQYAPRTGVYTVGDIDRFNWQSRSLRPVDNVEELPLDRDTVASVLQKAGYATGMFGKWHLGNKGEQHPSKRGFDEAIVSAGRHFDFKTQPPVEYAEGTYLADFLTDKAVDFIERHQQEPFFLYLPHYAVHGPHHAKEEIIARFRDKAAAGGHQDPSYAAMIASVDESVGRVVETLDRLGLSENTLVIFSSDNGGVGGYQREGINGGSITDNAPLRGGKGMLYEGGVRVPYVFRWPGKIPAGIECDVPIISVDLLPSLAEIAGAKLPSQPLDGESYLKLLTSGGRQPLKREALYWHFPGYLGSANDTWRTTPAGAIRQDEWKLIEFFEDGRLELYNLADDPSQKTNLADKQPERTRQLHAKLVAWRKDVGAPMPTPNTGDAKVAPAGQRKKRGKKQAARQTKTADVEVSAPFGPVACAGTYPGHLQGVCTDGQDSLYWSFTTVLVKTDRSGQVQSKVDVATHHGDLCFHDGKIYVAVNLGKFNLPAGSANSWVYVYDAGSLAELSRHAVPEAVHGAGGIEFREGRFLVVGGLPPGTKENYVYEYDQDFKFLKRHVLDSGYTLMGIQTIAWADGAWWFGCYGAPQVLLKADPEFNLIGKWQANASLGIAEAGGGKLLVAGGARLPGGYTGTLSVAVPDASTGLKVIQTLPPR